MCTADVDYRIDAAIGYRDFSFVLLCYSFPFRNILFKELVRISQTYRKLDHNEICQVFGMMSVDINVHPS